MSEMTCPPFICPCVRRSMYTYLLDDFICGRNVSYNYLFVYINIIMYLNNIYILANRYYTYLGDFDRIYAVVHSKHI